MKNYFGKQVIERPRRGSSAPSHKISRYGKIVLTEDGPEYFGATKIKMHMGATPHRTWDDDKGFTDVLGPLKGYLRSSCGRPWDDVYSELAKVLGSAGYALGHIITDHLNVATNTWRGTDGNVYDDRDGTEKVGGYYSQFYVEPETGLLRDGDSYSHWYPRKYKAPPVPATEIAIGDDSEYACIKGIWYYTEFVWDVAVTEHKGYRGNTYTTEEKTKRNTLKRQLGKKELRDLGLRRVRDLNPERV